MNIVQLKFFVFQLWPIRIQTSYSNLSNIIFNSFYKSLYICILQFIRFYFHMYLYIYILCWCILTTSVCYVGVFDSHKFACHQSQVNRFPYIYCTTYLYLYLVKIYRKQKEKRTQKSRTDTRKTFSWVRCIDRLCPIFMTLGLVLITKSCAFLDI